MIRFFVVGIMVMLCLNVKAEIIRTFAWEGNLGDKVNFRVDIAENERGVLTGYTTYFHPEKNFVVPMYGFCDNQNDSLIMKLTEFDYSRQCGYMELTLNVDFSVRSGYWALGYEFLRMKDLKNMDFDSTHVYFQPLQFKEVRGTYRFTFNSDNQDLPKFFGSCELRHTGDNTVKWKMEQVTPNYADGEGESEFDNSFFNGDVTERIDGEVICSFQFWAYIDKRFVIVKCINPDDEFCFGHGATLEGMYVR